MCRSCNDFGVVPWAAATKGAGPMTMPTYRATHRVPPQGMRAWSSPDPNLPSVDVLSGGLDVQVLQRFGGWAQVQCSNGWLCWVDGNSLQPIGVAPSTTPSYQAATTGGASLVAPFSLLAGALVVLSTFLPWFTLEGLDDLNAFKIPASFLWSIDSAPTDSSLNSIGGVMVLIGVVIVLTAFVRNQAARRIAGAVAVFFCVDYTIELLRSLNDTPGAPGLFSVLGFGVYIAIVGAAISLADFGSRR